MIYLGTSATLLAMVTAGSRSVIAECLQVIGCIVFLGYYRPSEFGKITTSVFALTHVLAFILYSQVDLFKEGLNFLTLRFEEAANVEGNPIEAYLKRYTDIIVAPYQYSQFTSFFGNGLGSATRAGAALGGRYGGAEISWSRPILENGLIIGIFFIIWRLWITKDLLISCIKALKRGSYLAIFLFGAAGPILLFGLLGQPTNLGFAAFGSGLCLAAAISEKTFLKLQTKVLVITNYRKDQQQSMLRFANLLTSEKNSSLNLDIKEIYPTPVVRKVCQNGKFSKWASYIDKYLLFPKRLKKSFFAG